MKKKIFIDSEMWILNLSSDNELSFSYSVPYEKSIYSTNPLWQSWSNDIGDDIYDYFNIGGVSNLNIFRLKKILFTEIIKFLKENNVTFFFFSPNTHKKFNIYKNLCELFIMKLGDEWNFQICEHWFYFNKYK